MCPVLRALGCGNSASLLTQVLDGVLAGAVRQLPALRRLVDGVALADLLLGFAEVAAEGQGGGGLLGRCTRPQLQREGPLAIVQVPYKGAAPVALMQHLFG